MSYRHRYMFEDRWLLSTTHNRKRKQSRCFYSCKSRFPDSMKNVWCCQNSSFAVTLQVSFFPSLRGELGRPTWHPDYLDRIKRFDGSLQAVERMTVGFRAGTGHDGLDKLEVLPWLPWSEAMPRVAEVHGNVAYSIYRTITWFFSLFKCTLLLHLHLKFKKIGD